MSRGRTVVVTLLAIAALALPAAATAAPPPPAAPSAPYRVEGADTPGKRSQINYFCWFGRVVASPGAAVTV